MSEKHKPDRDPAFAKLIVRHDRAIRAYLRSMLPTLADVDEVMQEVSVVAWRKFDQLDDPDNFRQWACVIARYEVLKHLRSKARDRLILGRDIEELMAAEGLEEIAIREAQLAALEHCLDKLPPRTKQLVLHTYSAGQSLKELAWQIGKTPDALYQLVCRVRRKLLGCVERSLAVEIGK